MGQKLANCKDKGLINRKWRKFCDTFGEFIGQIHDHSS